MFYSQCLLSKKGPLRAIWLAAYSHKKLKKDQVSETNISSSVDEIMLNEDNIAYRVLSYLLLGVVRIYSKKVEYLYHDCNKTLNKINKHVRFTKDNPPMEAMRAPYLSITLPDNFDLDAFNMEVLEEDVRRDNVITNQQITLQETWKDAVNEHYTLEKYHHEEDIAPLETTSAIHTPIEGALSPHRMDIDMMVSPSHTLTSLEPSVEKLQDNEFLEEEGRDLEFFRGAVEPLDLNTQFNDVYNQADWTNLLEITPPDLGQSHVHSEGHTVDTTADETPDVSKFPYVSGTAPPEFMVIQTPAKVQQLRFSRKRKYLFEETIALSNKVVRQNLRNTSSLVRRKAPLTALNAWKAFKISKLRQDFMDPLFSCMSSQLKDLFYKTNFRTPEPVEAAEVPIKSRDGGFEPPSKSSDQKAISESVNHSESVGFVESPTTDKSDTMGPINSFATTGDELSAVETQDLGLNLMDEEIGPREEVNQSPDGWPARTGTTASHILKSFLNQKDQSQKESLNLALVLEGRTRKENARFFYDILVLKSQGFVDVKQDTPYSDVHVLKTLPIESDV